MISLLVLACMVHACVFILLLSLAWVLTIVTVVLSLSLPFLDSHGVMELSCFGGARLLDGFEVEWGVLRIDHMA